MRSGKEDSAHVKYLRTLAYGGSQLSVGIICLFNFFKLHSANADLVKPAFCGGKYSNWQPPCTAGKMPRGPSPVELRQIRKHECLKIQCFLFLSFLSLAKIKPVAAPQRYLFLLLILLILNIKIKYKILIF